MIVKTQELDGAALTSHWEANKIRRANPAESYLGFI